MRQVEERVVGFEMKYQTTLDRVMVQGLLDDTGHQFHEDFIEWEYWQEVGHETRMIIENVKRILRKAVESSVLH